MLARITKHMASLQKLKMKSDKTLFEGRKEVRMLQVYSHLRRREALQGVDPLGFCFARKMVVEAAYYEDVNLILCSFWL